ncbi:YhbY family RNA-binding protein [Lacticaseibacillus pantheris]|uniref:YhbY family RNA-binding protein n=1 Tax=Lacticaseibacillus pantheris TaxID=171523 RepID=UPI0021E859E4|nr:YhbY family RNA-binding protein [Lacticaseibacillus pantheris]
MKPLVNVGKNGLSDHLVQSVADAVESRELVKVSLLQTSDTGLRRLARTCSRRYLDLKLRRQSAGWS